VTADALTPQDRRDSGAPAVAAWVGAHPIPVSVVDQREAALRAGRRGAVLPPPHTSEGRQLRRWLVQVLVAERLVAVHAAAHGLAAPDAPPLAALAPDRAALLSLGSVAASLLGGNALARAVFAHVTADVRVPPGQVAAYHRANPERFTRPPTRLVRHALLDSARIPDDLDQRPMRALRPGDLVGPVQDAVFAAAAGDLVGPVRDSLGWHVLRVIRVLPGGPAPLVDVHAEIEAHLLGAARRRAFTAWLDRQRAAEVRLAVGYEHPGDPAQPDNHHRH
jgi:[acyl-carrier-protein] S-malonyltransferase